MPFLFSSRSISRTIGLSETLAAYQQFAVVENAHRIAIDHGVVVNIQRGVYCLPLQNFVPGSSFHRVGAVVVPRRFNYRLVGRFIAGSSQRIRFHRAKGSEFLLIAFLHVIKNGSGA